jgi:hypothetical protein
MWSLQLMVEGRRSKDQIREAAALAEQARRQVLVAIRDAKRAWKEIRDETRAAGRELARETKAAGREALREQARTLRAEVKAQARAERRPSR